VGAAACRGGRHDGDPRHWARSPRLSRPASSERRHLRRRRGGCVGRR
jgi:hypothetical protein